MTEIGLTLSRSLGHHGARSIGVTSEAEVKEVQLQKNDLFIIIGTDGLWQYIDYQEAVDFVFDELKSEKNRGANYNQYGLSRVTMKLVNLAVDRWREEQDDFRDDISAVIITFPSSDPVYS